MEPQSGRTAAFSDSSRPLSWSYSRVDVFTRCKLEYYYAYYASRNGWDRKASKETRELFILKNTKNRYAWMGDLVHAVIEDYLREAAQGTLPDKETLLKRADTRMRREYTDSKNQRYRQTPGRICGLVEHENNLEPADHQWKRIHENVMECTANFFYTDFYRNQVALKSPDIIRIERLDHFDLDGIRVYARPDVAVKTADSLSILDWKTGAENDEHEFQICYYILYGIHKMAYPLDKIRASLVYLKDNTVKETSPDAEQLERAVSYLKETFDQLKAFDETAPTLLPEELPRAKAKSTCTLCRFQKLCR